MPVPAYTLRLGPLSFIAPADAVSRTLGEALDNVGTAIVPAERRPRPLKLKVPVEGDPHTEADPKAYGDRLRRQTEQLLDNRRWLSHGLYLYWEVGDLLAGWVLVGGGELSEADPGISFGMYELELTDLYIVGTPGTHRPGRRLDLADRRLPTIPRDTRGLLYTDAFAATPALSRLFIPGAARAHRSSSRQARTIAYGPQRSGPVGDSRYLWQYVDAAVDGEVVTYIPDRFLTDLDPRRAPVELDDFSAVKAWDQNLGTIGGGYSFDPLATAGSQDYTPDEAFGWERLFGTPTRTDRYLALENGSIRVRWLGGGTLGPGVAGGGLVFEWWDDEYTGGPRYRPEGRFMHVPIFGSAGNDGYEVTIPELTLERGILEVRYGDYCLRAILQRGWTSVRLESYLDVPGADWSTNARLEWTPVNPFPDDFGALTITQPAAAPLDWVQSINTVRQAPDTSRAILVAPAADTYMYDPGAPNLSGDVGAAIYQNETNAPNVVVVQVAAPFRPGTVERDLSTAAEVAALSLVDARAVPVLVAR